jgi:hypothetical protein
MWYNPLVTALLRSPLYRVMGNMLLLTYTGRKSGRPYTFPISYGRRGNCLWLITHRRKTWWKNVQGGAPVTVRLAGRDQPGQAEIVNTNPTELMEAIRLVYRGMPHTRAEALLPDMVLAQVRLTGDLL